MKRREVHFHSVGRKLLSGDERILLLWALNDGILAWLIEERNAVSLAIVVTWFARSFDAVESRLEAVVTP